VVANLELGYFLIEGMSLIPALKAEIGEVLFKELTFLVYGLLCMAEVGIRKADVLNCFKDKDLSHGYVG
jgi:hypothetical protein